ncbi:creatininase family protein [Streptomyces sp. NPDC101213]|uniref:creatininase family protein n=1 Tax=Streptomyces sp. NPDC101213 TaxID=3366130 RepID=UPI00380ECF36
MRLLPTATSTDVQEQQPRVTVLPIGFFEQHGKYLPLITDTAITCVLAQEIAAACPVRLLPPITISCSHEHAAFPGTVSISAKTLHAVIDNIRASLARTGIHKLVIVNGHGGNYVLSNVVQEANVGGPSVSSSPSASTGAVLASTAAWSLIGTRTCTSARSRPRSCSMLPRS